MKIRIPFLLSVFVLSFITFLYAATGDPGVEFNTNQNDQSSVNADKTPVPPEAKPWQIVRRENIAKVWAGNPVGFAFEQKENFLFIAFYDGMDRKMVLGQKDWTKPESAWTFKKLETAIGWDSHNYIRIAFDSENYLHIAGNMHAVPLIYFRSTRPLDIQSVEPVHRMLATDLSKEARVKALENRCTYPHFLKDADGKLIFGYRDGGSGNGNQIWNVYDVKTKTWSRLLDVPMFDGEGDCNAYYHGPDLGPDGYYHVAWVWRDTPDCATNHDLSYMKSRDLLHWEKSDGTPQTLPVTRANSEIVAPLQNGEGLLNPLVAIGFDQEGRVILTYTRYDEQKNNQIMQARREKDGWKFYQTTQFTHSWVFSGGGCIPGEMSFGAVHCVDGRLQQSWWRKYETSGEFVLDPVTLKPIGPAPRGSAIPGDCYKIENPTENMHSKRFDVRDATNPNRMFYFVWETFPVNRDRPYDVIPEPSTLRMFELAR